MRSIFSKMLLPFFAIVAHIHVWVQWIGRNSKLPMQGNAFCTYNQYNLIIINPNQMIQGLRANRADDQPQNKPFTATQFLQCWYHLNKKCLIYMNLSQETEINEWKRHFTWNFCRSAGLVCAQYLGWCARGRSLPQLRLCGCHSWSIWEEVAVSSLLQVPESGCPPKIQ